MKLLVLAAILAAAASSPVTQVQTWPWQVGKVYHYDVHSYTWAKFEQGFQNGTAIKAQFVVSVKDVGHLQAKLESPLHAAPDKNSDFQPLPNIDQPFEIFVDGGRIGSINFPSSLSVTHENLIKAFLSALQVDVSQFGYVHDYSNNYDHESFQGLFKKMEGDITGECETLYSVMPVSAEWRHELPEFSSEEDPVEIVKTKNFGSCAKRVTYDFGVPKGGVWAGIAQGYEEKQFIKHTYDARILAGKQGTIYKSEVKSAVSVSPLVYGKQKAEVHSVVTAYLKSVEQEKSVHWQLPKEFRSVKSLLFTVDNSWRLFTFGDEHNIAKAQQVLQQITPLLQDPGHLQKGDFLVQFNVLVFLVMSMNSQQLAQLTKSIEVAKSSKNIAKNAMWIIYRDAVAEAGTVGAYNEIKSWVLTKKIEGEEAAQLISVLSTTISHPSKTMLTDFFNFATCPEVLGQKFVNNSALLAITKMLRFSKQDQFIVDTVIPRFSKELKQAIDNGESSKAQVYVRVLGNLAHPGILKAFAPYLEGQVTVTKYLRTQIVASLKTLANLRDKYVRSVLYSILKNTAEPYEVRVAAALNIFLAFPTTEMMQVMAHMTNNDPSTQVRAVLATSIGLAAGLKDPRFAELAKTAKSVLDIVSKEKFGYSYSTESLIDGYTGDDEFSYFRELSYIGSEDTLLPKYHRSALRFKGTAFGDERQITLSISSIQNLIDNLASRIYEPTKVNPNFKFSAKQIIEALNIKRAPWQPLEGALFVENFSQEKLVTFDENEFYAFIKYITDNMEQIIKGVEVHFTKILRPSQIYVDFPLSSGMSFTYQYSEPLVFHAQGESKFVFDGKTKAGFLESKINVTYARDIIGTVGFMDTVSEVLIGAGVINKLQIHIPGKIKTTFKIGGELSVQVEPLQADKDINLIHLSVLPYTGTQKKDSVTYNLNVLEGSPKALVTNDVKFGHNTGMYYRFHGRSYSSDNKFWKQADDDFFTNLGHLLYQKDIAFSEYNFKYLKTSVVKSVAFSLYFDQLYNQKNPGELGPPTLINHIEPNSVPRRAELVKKVSSGIEAAQVLLVDVSVVFDGPKKVEYIFTGAYAESFVDPKFQAVAFANLYGYDQINAVFKLNSQEAKVVPLNFAEALKNKIKITYNGELKVGEDKDIKWEGYGERSEKYTELLKADPMGKSCLQDVSKHNFYQKDCHKMIIKAHAPDYFKTTVSYKGLDSTTIWELVDLVYQSVKDEKSWEEEFDPFVKFTEDKVLIEAQSYYFDNYDNYNITTKYGSFGIKNVERMSYETYATAVYGPITAWERSRNYFTDYQYMPYCAVDDNKIRTFSGRSYDYQVSGSWHVVMVDESNEYGKFDDLLILARRPSEKQEEVYVSYKAQTGKYVELEITPTNVQVNTNGVKTCEGALTMYWDDSDKDFEAPLLQYYTLADGIQVFNIHDNHLRVVYDHHRLIIFTNEHRNTTRGICGQSSGQTSDDYITPWGLVTLPEHYGASYALEGEFSDPKTTELKKEAKQKAYQPVTKYTKIFDGDWSKVTNKIDKNIVV